MKIFLHESCTYRGIFCDHVLCQILWYFSKWDMVSSIIFSQLGKLRLNQLIWLVDSHQAKRGRDGPASSLVVTRLIWINHGLPLGETCSGLSNVVNIPKSPFSPSLYLSWRLVLLDYLILVCTLKARPRIFSSKFQTFYFHHINNSAPIIVLVAHIFLWPPLYVYWFKYIFTAFYLFLLTGRSLVLYAW